MALVRVRIRGVEKNMGRALAEASGVEILDQPTHRGDGTPRPATRRNGRPNKPKTSVAEQAAKKKAAPQPELADGNDTTAEEKK